MREKSGENYQNSQKKSNADINKLIGEPFSNKNSRESVRNQNSLNVEPLFGGVSRVNQVNQLKTGPKQQRSPAPIQSGEDTPA